MKPLFTSAFGVHFSIAFCLAFGLGLLSPAAALDKPAAASPALAAAAPTQQQHAEALKVIGQLHAAIKMGDSLLAERVLARDVQIFEQGHRESSRAEYLGHHFLEDAAYAKAVTTTITAQLAHGVGDTVLVMEEAVTVGTYKGKSVNATTLGSYVLARRSGLWQVMHIHWSSRKRN